MIVDLILRIAQISLSTSLLILLLLLLVPLLQKRYRAKWRYMAWLLIAVRLLIPFSPTFPQSLVRIEMPVPVAPVISQPVENTPSTGITPAIVEADTLPEIAVESPIVSSTDIPPLQIMGSLWIAGALIFLLFQISSYWVFLWTLRRRGYNEVPKHIHETLIRISSEMDIRKPPMPLISSAVDAPVLAGIIHPHILLPHEKYSDGEVSFILRHELVHYRRKDMWYKLVLLLANTIHWFNPLVYVMTAKAAKDIELVCDDDVTQNLSEDDRVSYGETILAALPINRRLTFMFSTQFGSTKKNIRFRLRNLFDRKVKSKGIAALCVVAVCAVVLTGMIPVSAAASSSNPLMSDGAVTELSDVAWLSGLAVHATGDTWGTTYSGIDGKTYKEQLDEEIKWLQKTYEENGTPFVITESLPEKEITNTASLKYLYEHSDVYQAMSKMNDGVFHVADSNYSTRWGMFLNSYQRTAVMLENSEPLILDIDYTLKDGTMAVWLIDPYGKVVYQGELVKSYKGTHTVTGAKGLWSVVTLVGDAYKGGMPSITLSQKNTNSNQPIKSEQNTSYTIEQLGSYRLSKNDCADINLNWDGSGHLIFLDTPRSYTDEEFAEMIEAGFLGGPRKVSEDQQREYAKKYADTLFHFSQALKSPLKYNGFTYDNNTYHFYLIRIGDTGNVSGSITIKKDNGSDFTIWNSKTN